jgi:hypothetical protein
MNKFNLKNNDIVIILVIFIFFCVFVYVNNYNTYENFGIAIKHKNNKEIIIEEFITKLKDYITKIKNLNTTFYEFLEFLNQKKYAQKDIFEDVSFIDNLNKIKDTLNEMKNIHLIKDDKNVFNDFFDIHNDYIFNEYTILFNELDNGKSQMFKICDKEYANLNPYYDFLNNIQNVKNYNLDKLDNKIAIIDIYFKNFKSIDKYNNIMDIFKDYRFVLINLFNNFNEIKNIITKLINECDSDSELKKLNKNHNITIRQFRTTNKIIEDLLDLLDSHINKVVNPLTSSEQSQNIYTPADKLLFETKFCEKLKNLNKPDKSNIIFKRFTNDIIQQKIKYVKKLEDNIRLIQDQMTEIELNSYNLNRIRTDDHAKKQHTAIKQAINNIKNRNKIKINLS